MKHQKLLLITALSIVFSACSDNNENALNTSHSALCISFVDQAVEAYAKTWWDANHDYCIDNNEANAVNVIPDFAFAYNQQIASLDDFNQFPNLTTIGNSAFWGCINLNNANILNITHIGNSAFAGCTSLTTLNAPNVAYIGNAAFSGCSNLTTVNVPAQTSSSASCPYNAHKCSDSGQQLLICANNGWDILENCPNGCKDNACIKTAQQLPCTEGELKCADSGNMLVICQGGNWTFKEYCACTGSTCNSSSQVICPDQCQNNCDTNGLCNAIVTPTCPSSCPNDCDDQGNCNVPPTDECFWGKDANGDCYTAKYVGICAGVGSTNQIQINDPNMTSYCLASCSKEDAGKYIKRQTCDTCSTSYGLIPCLFVEEGFCVEVDEQHYVMVQRKYNSYDCHNTCENDTCKILVPCRTGYDYNGDCISPQESEWYVCSFPSYWNGMGPDYCDNSSPSLCHYNSEGDYAVGQYIETETCDTTGETRANTLCERDTLYDTTEVCTAFPFGSTQYHNWIINSQKESAKCKNGCSKYDVCDVCKEGECVYVKEFIYGDDSLISLKKRPNEFGTFPAIEECEKLGMVAVRYLNEFYDEEVMCMPSCSSADVGKISTKCIQYNPDDVNTMDMICTKIESEYINVPIHKEKVEKCDLGCNSLGTACKTCSAETSGTINYCYHMNAYSVSCEKSGSDYVIQKTSQYCEYGCDDSPGSTSCRLCAYFCKNGCGTNGTNGNCACPDYCSKGCDELGECICPESCPFGCPNNDGVCATTCEGCPYGCNSTGNGCQEDPSAVECCHFDKLGHCVIVSSACYNDCWCQVGRINCHHDDCVYCKSDSFCGH